MKKKPFETLLRDRCRTTNNLLGDAYGAAIVEALSKRELEAMDSEKQKEMEQEHADLESAQALLSKTSGSMVETHNCAFRHLANFSG